MLFFFSWNWGLKQSRWNYQQVHMPVIVKKPSDFVLVKAKQTDKNVWKRRLKYLTFTKQSM